MSHSLLNISKIVNILIEDEYLLQNWKPLCHLLEIPTNEVMGLAQRLQLSIISYAELFQEILQRWVSRQGQEASLSRLQDKLNDENFVNVAEQLGKIPQDTILTNPTTRTAKACDWGHFGVKKCISNFVGRKSDLQKLKTLVDSNEFLVAVTGMGGVGKSTLVLKLIQDLLASNENDNATKIRVIWFHCGHGSSLEGSINKFADHAHVEISKNQSSLELFQKCIHSFQDGTTANDKTILIFDNVDEIHSNLIQILKSLNSFSLISPSSDKAAPILTIVTSTLLPMTQYSGKSIQLDVLEEKEGIQFLQNNLPPELTTDIETLRKLCKSVRNLPRTLQQAVDRIKQLHTGEVNPYGVEEYIQDLEHGSPRRKRKILDHPLSPIEHCDSDHTTTLNTWRPRLRCLSKQGMEGQWAVKLHNLLSYLDSDETSIQVLKKVINCATFFLLDGSKKIKLTDSAHDRIDTALKLLKEHHLIYTDGHKQTVQVHPMVKKSTRIHSFQMPNSSLVLSEVLGHVQFNLLSNTDENNNTVTWWDDEVIFILCDIWKQVLLFPELVERYAPTGVRVTSHSKCPLQLLSSTVEEMTSIFPEAEPLLITAKINYFFRLCRDQDDNAEEGVNLLTSLVADSTVFLGAMHPEVVRGRSLLEEAVRSRSRLSQYIRVAEDCLSAEEGDFSYENKVAKLLQIGKAYEESQQFDPAIEYYLSALVWAKLKENRSEDDEKNAIQRITHCCEQIGKSIDQYFNFDGIPSYDDDPSNLSMTSNEKEEPPSSSDDRKNVKRFKWKPFLKKLTQKVKHLEASDIRRIISALKLDMLPHR